MLLKDRVRGLTGTKTTQTRRASWYLSVLILESQDTLPVYLGSTQSALGMESVHT